MILVVVCFLTMLPLIVDLIGSVIPMGRLTQHTTSYALVAAVMFLITAATVLWGVVYFPYFILSREMGAIGIVTHCIICFFFLWSTVFHYYKSIWLNPGYVNIPDVSGAPPPPPRDSVPFGFEEAWHRDNFSERKYCTKCNLYRSDGRTHHCSVCKRCVDSMDHHCPFIANCVGRRNHKHFILFLLFLWLGNMYGLLMSSWAFMDCYLGHVPERMCQQTLKYRFVFVCGLILGLPLSAVVSWQFYVGYTNVSTVELIVKFKTHSIRDFLRGLWRDFRKGSFSRFKRIFGDKFLQELFLPWPRTQK